MMIFEPPEIPVNQPLFMSISERLDAGRNDFHGLFCVKSPLPHDHRVEIQSIQVFDRNEVDAVMDPFIVDLADVAIVQLEAILASL